MDPTAPIPLTCGIVALPNVGKTSVFNALKAAGIQAVVPGTTGEAVHRATTQVILDAGYRVGLPGEDEPLSYCGMTHGTGHGVGFFLNVHEGPQAISKSNSVKIQNGMILSNEPGYYKKDKFIKSTLGGCIVEEKSNFILISKEMMIRKMPYQPEK
mgnify:CR=1 FL=1